MIHLVPAGPLGCLDAAAIVTISASGDYCVRLGADYCAYREAAAAIQSDAPQAYAGREINGR